MFLRLRQSLVRISSILLLSVGVIGDVGAAGAIVNQASQTYFDNVVNKDLTLQSNVVKVIPTATIRYFTNSNFTTQTGAGRLGGQFNLEITAAGCNLDENAIDKIHFSVTSRLTGDVVWFDVPETGVNTAIFRLSAMDRDASTGIGQSEAQQMVKVLKGDTLTTRLEGCGPPIEASLLIDPAGVVFDSRSDLPLAGATVTLIDVLGSGNGGAAGQPATVFDFDGVTPRPSTVVTGADGRFEFPKVAASRYRLAITPAPSYSFPSKVPPSELSAGHPIHVTGSYGGEFPVDANTGAVFLDVPLDLDSSGLLVEKVVSRTIAELGDFIDYTITVRNNGQVLLRNISLRDQLPAGFQYVRNSLRVNRLAVADPLVGSGTEYVYPVGDLDAGAFTILTYRVKLGPGSLEGDGISRGQASSSLPIIKVSNNSIAKVSVRPGVFSSKGFIIGAVYLDCNGNRLHDLGEPGIPGVRILMQDGTSVITDMDGKYSFSEIAARTHVLKLDASTLPSDVTLGENNRTKFADVKNGELFKAEFDIGGCSESVKSEIAARRLAMQKSGKFGVTMPTALAIPAPGSAAARGTPSASSSAIAASAAAGNLNAAQSGSATSAATAAAASASMAAAGNVTAVQSGANFAAAKPLAKEELAFAADLDNKIGFVDLEDGAVLGQAQTPVRVKGMAGTTFELTVNGVAVGANRVGRKSSMADRQLEVWEYIGINMQPGRNVLEVFQRDSFGNARGSKRIAVTAPGNGTVLTLSTPKLDIPADGKTMVRFAITLSDANGVAVRAASPLTLESSRGIWQASDMEPKELGVQTTLTDGKGEFLLQAPTEEGEALIRVKSGSAVQELKIYFVPDLQPMIAAGLIEGMINVRHFNRNALAPARNDDGFEETLRNFSRTLGNNADAQARAALFIKGKIKGDYLLTLGYESEKEKNQKLFRDINPNAYYPVYGDGSAHAFDAQSTSKLYVRIAKDRNWVLYGDFTPPPATPARNLGAYNRSLNGVRQHLENERGSLDAFASRDSTRQVIAEVRANGTSGPYQLPQRPLIINSEQVEVLVRDRNQPSLIISTTPQMRLQDYEVEPLSGTVLFRAPIASLDPDLNPVSIRVTYEVDQGGANFLVAGASGQLKLTDNIEVGGSYVTDRNPQDPASIKSANATIRVTENTTVIAETAQTSKASIGTGRANRIEVTHTDGKLEAKVMAARADAQFENLSSTLGRGRTEASARGTYAVNESTRVAVEAIHSADVVTGAARDGVLAGMALRMDNGIQVEAGVRRTHETAPEGVTLNNPDTTSVRVKVTAPVPNMPAARVFAEIEQDVVDSQRKVVAIGGDYQLNNGGRLYARHELISSLGSNYALNDSQQRNATVIGLDADYMKDGRIFSEYRARNDFSGPVGEAAIGLRNLWQVQEGIRLGTSFERVQVIDGDRANQGIALTTSIELNTDPNWKATARAEGRRTDASQGYLNTTGLAYKLNEELTFLGKTTVTVQQDRLAGSERIDALIQTGVAYRSQETLGISGLAKYEYRLERDSGFADIQRMVHVIAANMNYQPTRDTIYTVRYAGKLANDRSGGLASHNGAHLLGARVRQAIGNDYDASLISQMMISGGLDTRQYGVGVEGGYRMREDLWVSAGYNFFGFNDRDLSASNYTNRGVYFRMRYKFDERALPAALSAVPGDK